MEENDCEEILANEDLQLWGRYRSDNSFYVIDRHVRRVGRILKIDCGTGSISEC